MRPYIQRYLSSPDPTGLGEKTVVILTSKVAQKSYGTEKRFLCPPPTTILEGISWWTSKENHSLTPIIPLDETGFDKALAPPRVTISIAGENAMQTGQVEWYTCSGTSVGQTTSFSKQQTESATQDSHPSRFKSSESRNTGDTYHNPQLEPLAAGKCVSKHLFINDADEKRKRVECLIRLQLANGLQLGTIASKAIKVISKPSKKRQSAKNMELCLHHGTTVSLFNRIRSQTVSTKYLGVSTGTNSPFYFPGQNKNPSDGPQEGTCFVARTTCWDPFVIWIVDTTRVPSDGRESDLPEDYIGRNAFVRSVPYPPPPAIALKNKTSQLVPIHYNQHIVLQCLTTGLVSPVMIIRKVDKASTVVGGARTGEDATQTPGGEYGDEVLGDPVSQLHKIALQIVQEPKFRQEEEKSDMSSSSMPRSSYPISYLACLNDMVGMHKTSEPRKPIHDAWDLNRMYDLFDVTSQEGGKVVRKRRVSTDILSSHPSSPPGKLVASSSLNDLREIHDTKARHRVNSLQEDYFESPFFGNPRGRSGSIPEPAARKLSVSSSGSAASGRRGSLAGNNGLGSFWSEDVTDAAVWTIVGTDCATYTFWTPPTDDPLSTQPFPLLSHISVNSKESSYNEQILSLHGENFSRDLQVWFGDLKAPLTEYKGRELLICKLPTKNELIECQMRYKEIPILLVRADGTICKTKINYCK
ncbi:beta-trefoil [Backusella circina FSU 941]|nr:beta-trefoil [Backusella circina FSU 941]